MPEPIQFGVFDPKAEVAVSQRYLPHWFQPGVAIFITFRTADSLPAKVAELWDREQADWLARNAGPLTGSLEDAVAALPTNLQREFQRHRSQAWQGHLDAGHGECLLRRPELATIVGDSLRHFDGERYDLDSFVVMPNHVHVLGQFRPGNDPRKQCGEWQRYSARLINAKLNRRGGFWQSEPFDHLVRSPEQFSYLQNYVAENPVKAKLAAGEYLHWKRS